MARVEVRRIRADEWRQLRDVRLRALLDAPDAFLTTHAEASAVPDDEWRAATRRRATGDVEAAFVAVGADRLVGLVGVYTPTGDDPTGDDPTGDEPTGDDPTADDTVELVQMWTAPEARRTGLGRRLVDAVLEWAGERTVRLGVIRGNDAARNLYESVGFVDDTSPPRPGDPCADEIRMIRPSR